jgi:hypothetical protein
VHISNYGSVNSISPYLHSLPYDVTEANFIEIAMLISGLVAFYAARGVVIVLTTLEPGSPSLLSEFTEHAR